MNIKSAPEFCVASHWVFLKAVMRETSKIAWPPERAGSDILRSFQSDQGRPCRTPTVMPIRTVTPQKTVRILPASSAGSCCCFLRKTPQLATACYLRRRGSSWYPTSGKVLIRGNSKLFRNRDIPTAICMIQDEGLPYYHRPKASNLVQNYPPYLSSVITFWIAIEFSSCYTSVATRGTFW